MTFVDVLVSLVVLVPMGAVGVAALWRARLGLDPLECVAYGVPLGWVVCSLALLGVTTLLGQLSLAVVIAALFLTLSVTFGLWASAPVSMPRSTQPGLPDQNGASNESRSAPVDPVAARMTDVMTSGTSALTLAFASNLTTRPAQRFPAGIRLGARQQRRNILGRIGDLSGNNVSAWAVNTLGRVRDHISPLPVIVFGVIFLVWAQFWLNAVWYREDGLSVSSTHFTLDWAMHLGDVANLVYGDNYPIQAPRFADQAYGYHVLASFSAALITKLGVLPGYALAAHSMFGMVLCLLATFAFARRVLRRTSVAVLATLLFYLGGSFAWLLTVQQFNATGDLWNTLRYQAWGFAEYDLNGLFAWNQVLSYPITAQRAFIYGIPLLLLILTLLWLGLRRGSFRLFVAAALVTGTLPYSNGSVALLLPLMLPFLAVLFPMRRLSWSGLDWARAYPVAQWLTYGVLVLVLVLPQVYLQQGSEASGIQLRWAPGWNLSTPTATGQDPWWWYAVKNFGFLLMLIPLGLVLRNALGSSARRLLLAAMPLFVIGQTITFQPLEGDNAKLVMLWYLFGAIAAAAAVGELWRRARSAVLRVFLTGMVSSLLLTGILIHIEFVAQDTRIGFARADELRVGERVREETPPSAMFAVGQMHTNPVLMIGGRRILVGNWWHVYPHGYDARSREAALREIMRLGPDAEANITFWGVDYVAITPYEIENLDANLDAYRERYPLVIQEGAFEIFAVSTDAIVQSEAAGIQNPAQSELAMPPMSALRPAASRTGSSCPND